MALPAWPNTLPYDPSFDEFSREPVSKPITSEPEDGPLLQRVRSQTLMYRVPYALRMTNAQHAAFREFWITNLVQGVSHFTMPVMLDGRTKVTRRVYIEGASYRDQPHGLGWLVRFSLVIFNVETS